MRLFDLIIDIDNLVSMNNRLIEKFISNKYYNFSSHDIVIDYGLTEVFKNVGIYMSKFKTKKAYVKHFRSIQMMSYL